MPKTLRPSVSTLRPTMSRRVSGQPRGNVEGHSQGHSVGQQQVMSSKAAASGLTDVSSSSSSAAASTSVHPASDYSSNDVPDCTTSFVPVPPPPPSSPPPPPAPPLLFGPGKLLPTTNLASIISHSGTNDAHSAASHSNGVPPCPPGPAPVLLPASQTLLHQSRATSAKPDTVLDDRAAAAGVAVDVAAIEAARLRLKKPVRTDSSAVCKFHILHLHQLVELICVHVVCLWRCYIVSSIYSLARET